MPAEHEILQSIFDHIPVMISFFDGAGRLLHVNREWERTFGWTLEEARHIDILEEAYPDPLERLAVQEFARCQDRRWATFRPRTRDGRVLDTSWMCVKLSDTSRIWFGLNITDRRRVEAERDQLLESAESARAEAEAALTRMRTIESVTAPALSRLSFQQRLTGMLARLSRVVQADQAIVMLPDQEQTVLVCTATHGPSCAERRVPFDTAIGRVFTQGRSVIVNDDPIAANDAWFPMSGVQSIIAVPLIVESRPTGVVTVGSLGTHRFSEEDLQILLLVAERVGPTIERARLVGLARAAHERLRALSRRLLTAHEEERRRVAVELHDDLGQLLTAARISLETAERASTGPALSHFHDAVTCVDQAMQRVRDLALDLRPSALDDLGLAAALRGFLDRLSRSMPFETHTSIDVIPELDSTLESTCFRLAQEAMTNAARHSQARHVWFDLHLLGDALELSIRDDGVGFDAAEARSRAISGASMGLLGMEERATLAGAEFEIVSEPGKGTMVRARFALAAAPAQA